MKTLNRDRGLVLHSDIFLPRYDLRAVKTGIVHIGIGGFHRSHLARYTHDLMNSILKGFNITIERVVITELKNSTYFARLVLQQENELGRKIVEIDARPSDCLALATAQPGTHTRSTAWQTSARRLVHLPRIGG